MLYSNTFMCMIHSPLKFPTSATFTWTDDCTVQFNRICIIRFSTFGILSYTGSPQIVYNFKDMKVFTIHMD